MPLDHPLLAATAEVSFVVTPADLAPALGSGDVPVLATPRLIAWLEAATVAAVAGRLGEGETTVGTSVEIDHVAASPQGAEVVAAASVSAVDGRRVEFECEALHIVAGADPKVIAQGRIARVVVDRQRFVDRIGRA